MNYLAALIAIAAGSAWAAPACVNAPLSSYASLGTGGCMLQEDGVTYTTSVVFRSFAFSGNADGIELQPDWFPWQPGMSFGGLQPGVALTVSYEIDAPADTAGMGTDDRIFQGLNVVENLCVGAPFTTDGSCSTGIAPALPLYNGPATFQAAEIIGVRDRIAMSGPDTDGYFTNFIETPDDYGFCECGTLGGGPDPAPVPEAGSLWLLAGGLGLLAIARRRK